MGNFIALLTNKGEIMRKMEMERQQQMQKKQMAMQIAGARDFCNWIGAFYAVSGVALFAGFRKTKKPALLAPLVPFTFVLLYNVDAAYGDKLKRIKREAENIMTNEAERLE